MNLVGLGAAPAGETSPAGQHRRGAATASVVADRVVLALPFSILRTLDYSAAGFSTLIQGTVTTSHSSSCCGPW